MIYYTIDEHGVYRKHQQIDDSIICTVPQVESDQEYIDMQIWRSIEGNLLQTIVSGIPLRKELSEYIIDAKMSLAEQGDFLVKSMARKKGIMDSEVAVFGTKALQALAYRDNGIPIPAWSAIHHEATAKGDTINDLVNKIIDAYIEQEEISGKLTALRRSASEHFNVCQSHDQVDQVLGYFKNLMVNSYQSYVIQTVGNAVPQQP